MDKLLTSLSELAAAAGGRLLLALLVLLLGRLMIRSLLRLLDKSRLLTRAEGTVRSFTRSFIKIGLHLLLTVSIIGILGVPMASVITVLASAGVTVGLALQGALSNLAGGVMLMLFRPFRQGDYISAAGVEGTVREVTLFYTVLMTVDNKRITVPNGGLMNATITDSSSEALRRADLCFTCARGEAPPGCRRFCGRRFWPTRGCFPSRSPLPASPGSPTGRWSSPSGPGAAARIIGRFIMI